MSIEPSFHQAFVSARDSSSLIQMPLAFYGETSILIMAD